MNRVVMDSRGLFMTEQQLTRIIRQVIQKELAVITQNVVPKTLTVEETSKVLGVEPTTLAVWRCGGKGPRYLKNGSRVMYLATDINDFIGQNRVSP